MGEHLTLVSPKLLGRLVVARSGGNDLLLPLPFGALQRADGVTLEIDLDDRNAPVRATISMACKALRGIGKRFI